jgi:hypothetical protein
MHSDQRWGLALEPSARRYTGFSTVSLVHHWTVSWDIAWEVLGMRLGDEFRSCWVA